MDHILNQINLTINQYTQLLAQFTQSTNKQKILLYLQNLTSYLNDAKQLLQQNQQQSMQFSQLIQQIQNVNIKLQLSSDQQTSQLNKQLSTLIKDLVQKIIEIQQNRHQSTNKVEQQRQQQLQSSFQSQDHVNNAKQTIQNLQETTNLLKQFHFSPKCLTQTQLVSQQENQNMQSTFQQLIVKDQQPLNYNIQNEKYETRYQEQKQTDALQQSYTLQRLENQIQQQNEKLNQQSLEIQNLNEQNMIFFDQMISNNEKIEQQQQLINQLIQNK